MFAKDTISACLMCKLTDIPDRGRLLTVVKRAARAVVQAGGKHGKTQQEYTGAWHKPAQRAPIVIQWQNLEAKDKAPTQQLVQARLVKHESLRDQLQAFEQGRKQQLQDEAQQPEATQPQNDAAPAEMQGGAAPAEMQSDVTAAGSADESGGAAAEAEVGSKISDPNEFVSAIKEWAGEMPLLKPLPEAAADEEPEAEPLVQSAQDAG